MSERSSTASGAASSGGNAKRKRLYPPYALILLALLLGAASLHKKRFADPAATRPFSSKGWEHVLAALPLSFEANQGQTDQQVSYLARGQGYTMFLTSHEVVLSLRRQESGAVKQKAGARSQNSGAGMGASGFALRTSDSVVRLRLARANPKPFITGLERLPGNANYFLGNDPNQWHTDVPTYAKVKYQGVYPGVDLVYYGNQGGQLEYDFVVAPGADPSQIGLAIDAERQVGNGQCKIDPNGDLVVHVEGDSDVRFHKPMVYQEQESGARSQEPGAKDESRKSKVENRQSTIGNRQFQESGVTSQESAPKHEIWNSSNQQSTIGNRQFVDARYVLTASNQVRFALGPYDHARPLVIDPVLSYSTYVGGTGGDIGYAIAVGTSSGDSGDAYITGVTNSTNFPTQGAEQGTNGGNGDAFITKVNAQGSKLLYSTYIGGSGADAATAIAVHAGQAYITGNTTSTNFPNCTIVPPTSGASTGTSCNSTVTASALLPFQASNAGGTDAFVTALNTDGNRLNFSSYLGGSGTDQGQGIAVDSASNVYVAGSTQSSNFPTFGNPFQSSSGGQGDAFGAVINSTGTAMVYSTYLGGSQADVAQAIAVASSGSTSKVYLTGYTFSTDFPIPSSSSPYQGANTAAPNATAFVAELTISNLAALSQSSVLTFSTYLGGTGDSRAFGIGLDGSSNLYITGTTLSTDFPVTNGAYQTTNHGLSDAFVCELNSNGSTLIYGTYLGGSGDDHGNAIAVNSAGDAFVTGSTNSSDFPTANAIQPVLRSSGGALCQGAACTNAFVTALNSSGTGVNYSTWLGGSGPDFAQGIALDSSGLAYVTGSTSSTTFPFPAIAGAFQSSLKGLAGNAFVAKIDTANNPTIAIMPDSINFGSQTLSVPSPQQQVTIVNPSTQPLVITAIAFNHPSSSTNVSVSTYGFAETNNCLGTVSPGASCLINVTFTPPSVSSQTDQLTLTDNAYVAGAVSTTQTITFSGTGATAATGVTVVPTSLTFANTTVGSSSSGQNVAITNTGTATLNISKISTTGDFVESDNCGSQYQNTLAVGQSCTASVTFSPTASGTRNGSLQISDNATGSPQTVALSGVGLAAFSLSTPPNNPNNPVLIGVTSTTFTIVANGPPNFTGNITLACSSGSTCAFNPATVGVGGTSTLTISNLTTTLPNPYAFTVTGTSGSQTASLQINLLFQDYTLSATPLLQTVISGGAAEYTILVNPLNGLSGQQIQLACGKGAPSASNCAFSNATPTPSGTASSVKLTIYTQKYVVPTLAPPLPPRGKWPPAIFGLLSLAALASLALSARSRARRGLAGPGWLTVRLAAISLILALNLSLGSCRPSTLVSSGTTTGNYSITITGTLMSNTAVVRSTVINLSVT